MPCRWAHLRWTPGTDPQPLPYQLRGIDPLTGTRLSVGDRPELTLTHADGQVTMVSLDLTAEIAPGGTRLYTFRYEPPALTVFDVERGAADPVVHWLPARMVTTGSTPNRPCWEDEHHLLLLLEHPDRQIDTPGIRLDTRTGAWQRLPLTPEHGHRPALVQPLLLR